jgi:hypothetical protein
VAIAGAALTAGLAYHVARSPGVYYGSADVVFVLPASTRTPNALGLFPSSLIATASVVQREVSGGPDSAHVVSGNVTIVDEGETSGVSVTLPNTGGQWANNFEQASLHVQVSDPNEAVALDRLASTVALIQSTLLAREDAANVSVDRRIRTEVSPRQLSVKHLTGQRMKALAATVALGLGATVALMVLADPSRRSPPTREASVKLVPRRRRQPLST